MYTYVQRLVCKRENTATYVHTGRVSNAYSRIRTARARVDGWVRTEKLRRRRVHGEATECVVFIGRHRNAWEPTGLDETADGNEAWRTAERRKRPCVRPVTFETGSCSSRGLAYRKMEETDLLRSKRGLVDREGCGIPQNG